MLGKNTMAKATAIGTRTGLEVAMALHPMPEGLQAIRRTCLRTLWPETMRCEGNADRREWRG